MKIEATCECVRISQVPEIGGNTADSFRLKIHSALTDAHKFIEIDLGRTQYLDSTGLGALISLWKVVRPRNGAVRLLNPNSKIQTILSLTHLNRVFEVKAAQGTWPAGNFPRVFGSDLPGSFHPTSERQSLIDYL